MDRYHVLNGSRTVPALRRGQSREQAVLYLLALAQETPGFLNNVAALMKVTDASANINELQQLLHSDYIYRDCAEVWSCIKRC